MTFQYLKKVWLLSNSEVLLNITQPQLSFSIINDSFKSGFDGTTYDLDTNRPVISPVEIARI